MRKYCVDRIENVMMHGRKEGEAQKVAIARLSARKEQMRLAILDEPSSVLDPCAEYERNKNIMERVGDATKKGGDKS